MTITLERFGEPRRLELAQAGAEGAPQYASCASCGALAPVIHGCLKSGGRIAVLDVGGWFKLAVFCGPCFEMELERKEHRDGDR